MINYVGTSMVAYCTSPYIGKPFGKGLLSDHKEEKSAYDIHVAFFFLLLGEENGTA